MQAKFTTTVYAAFLAAGVLSSPAGLVTNLNPVADAEMRQFSPDLNFGALSSMISGELGSRANFEQRRALVQFNISGAIPAGSTINSATLQVTVVMLPLSPVNSDFGLYRLLQSWSESQVTWNSRLSGTLWTGPGASDPADAATSASSTVFVTGLGTYIFPSTAASVSDLQAWVSNPSSNFGWLLLSEEGGPESARHFATREDTANAPILTIDYSPPSAPPAGPLISQVGRAGNAIHFSFNAESNRTYAIEFRPSLLMGAWSTLTNIPAQPSATSISITDAITADIRFYRVRTP